MIHFFDMSAKKLWLTFSLPFCFLSCVSIQPSVDSMASLCQSQQRCVKASVACQWQLAEAQDQLCGLELHGSESVEQEHAQALASSTELSQIEQEWKHKERMLGRSPTLCPEASRDVFDKVLLQEMFGLRSGPHCGLFWS